MDRPFDQPVRLGNGQRVVVLRTAQEVGAFLLQEWPLRRRGRKAYKTAVAACVRAIGGLAEAEVARQVFLDALEDLAKSSRQ